VFVTDPPGPMGPPPDELPLRPLVEALRADQLATLFVAVLLERRVLLRSQQYWLLSAVAEGLVELLHPFKFQHVYIPIMPYNLVDYLEVRGEGGERRGSEAGAEGLGLTMALTYSSWSCCCSRWHAGAAGRS
jgi:hypothetical protein